MQTRRWFVVPMFSLLIAMPTAAQEREGGQRGGGAAPQRVRHDLTIRSFPDGGPIPEFSQAAEAAWRRDLAGDHLGQYAGWYDRFCSTCTTWTWS